MLFGLGIPVIPDSDDLRASIESIAAQTNVSFDTLGEAITMCGPGEKDTDTGTYHFYGETDNPDKARPAEGPLATLLVSQYATDGNSTTNLDDKNIFAIFVDIGYTRFGDSVYFLATTTNHWWASFVWYYMDVKYYANTTYFDSFTTTYQDTTIFIFGGTTFTIGDGGTNDDIDWSPSATPPTVNSESNVEWTIAGPFDLTGTFKVGGATVLPDATEFNILDGATLSTAELNILDGVTATTAELNQSSKVRVQSATITTPSSGEASTGITLPADVTVLYCTLRTTTVEDDDTLEVAIGLASTAGTANDGTGNEFVINADTLNLGATSDMTTPQTYTSTVTPTERLLVYTPTGALGEWVGVVTIVYADLAV